MMVLKHMERDHLSTAAIRNRSRRRAAEQRKDDNMMDLWNCCGVGLAFGEESEDYEAKRENDRIQYEERKKAREEKEAELRAQFGKKMAQRHGTEVPMAQSFEVVD